MPCMARAAQKFQVAQACHETQRSLARPGCFRHLSLISLDLLFVLLILWCFCCFFGGTTMSIEALCFLHAATWQGQIQAACYRMSPILRFWARLGILQSSPGTTKKLGLGTRILRGGSHGISSGTTCCQAPLPDPL